MHKGTNHTEESKQKMSKAKKGKYAGENSSMHGKVGNLHPRYGKHHTEETKKQLSEAKKGENNPMYGKIGENNPNWNGGISFEPYSLEFNNQLKEQIRERDNYICQFCGINENGKKHSVHHINYNKKDCRPINLLALCLICNSKANKERDKWELFFTILQEVRGV